MDLERVLGKAGMGGGFRQGGWGLAQRQTAQGGLDEAMAQCHWSPWGWGMATRARLGETTSPWLGARRTGTRLRVTGSGFRGLSKSLKPAVAGRTAV